MRVSEGTQRKVAALLACVLLAVLGREAWIGLRTRTALPSHGPAPTASASVAPNAESRLMVVLGGATPRDVARYRMALDTLDVLCMETREQVAGLALARGNAGAGPFLVALERATRPLPAGVDCGSLTPGESPATRSPLRLHSWSIRAERGFVVAEGSVQNVSGDSLRHLEAVVSFLQKDGSFVKADSALVEFDPVLSGQTTPFRVISQGNPAISSARIEFRLFGGQSVGHSEGNR